MAEINANFVVEPIVATIQVQDPGITVTPEVTNLNIVLGGSANPGSPANSLQYNNGGAFGGVSSAIFSNGVLNLTAVGNFIANGNVSLGNVNNVKIDGGINGYILQTDGTGNLSWTVMTGGGGNGVPGGANNQIQYNDGGLFGASAGFTIDPTNNNVVTTGNLTANNCNIGNIFNGNIINGSNGNFSTDLRIQSSNLHLGQNAGLNNQQTAAIALGFEAGFTNQNVRAIGIGTAAGYFAQGTYSIALGSGAGLTFQGSNSIAIGTDAGSATQASNSIAIGQNAGVPAQQENTIILNATTANLSGNSHANAFYVKPVRNAATANLLYYNDTTGEISYGLPGNLVTSIISNGTSNVSIPSANGNVLISVAGTSNVISISNSSVVVNANVTVNGNASFSSTLTVQQIKEKVIANTTAATGNINFDLLNGAIELRTANATGNFNLNFRGNSTISLNTLLESNQSMTCSFINTNGNTAYILGNVTVDGSLQTLLWSGSTGNVGNGTINGKDLYIFNIIKTSSNTYTVLASRTGHV